MRNIFEAIPEAIIIVKKTDKSNEVVFRNHTMDAMLESIKLPNQMSQAIFRSISDYFSNNGNQLRKGDDKDNYNSN